MNTTQLAASLKSRTNSKGFTLIELIIVIAIIGILVAIAIPVYGAIQASARQRAIEASSKEAVKVITIALTDDDPATTIQTAEAEVEATSEKIVFIATELADNQFVVRTGWSDDGSYDNVDYWWVKIANY